MVPFRVNIFYRLVIFFDKISRPVRVNNNRALRVLFIKDIFKYLSITFFSISFIGLLLALSLLILPPPVWNKFDTILRDIYWQSNSAKIDKFRYLLKNDVLKAQEFSDSFFNLASDLQQYDYKESHYIDTLELALSSGSPKIRLRAAETGTVLRPNDSLFWFHLGTELLHKGQIEDGIKALQTAFRLRPFSSKVAKALIEALERIGNNDEKLKTKKDYINAVSMVVGNKASLTFMYVLPNGNPFGELRRIDSCVTYVFFQNADPNLRLEGIVFPPIDGLNVYIDKITKIKSFNGFAKISDNKFISEIKASEPFSSSPVIYFNNNSNNNTESLKLYFCLKDLKDSKL
jgi:hypothetical protein